MFGAVIRGKGDGCFIGYTCTRYLVLIDSLNRYANYLPPPLFLNREDSLNRYARYRMFLYMLVYLVKGEGGVLILE